MARLLVQFDTPELRDFRWTVFNEDASLADFQWQAAASDQLGEVAAQNPHPVILILPQQCIYLTQVELPEKVGRQVLSAIEFQIEDQLAQDIESQHFALGDSNQNPVSVAVVERAIMDRCLALARAQNLRLLRIVPELFLCPWPGEGVVLTEGLDGCLLRYGAYRGFKCNAQALPAMLELVQKEIDIDRLTYYARAADSTPEIDGYQIQRQELSSVNSGLVDAPLIDLQQRDFQMSSLWQNLGRAWKWIGIMLLLLLAAGAYNRAMALQKLERELSDIKQQQYVLLKPFLPGDVSVDDNLKKRLIQRLGELQADRSEQGFLQLLLNFTNARSSYPTVQISRIGYQGNRLAVDISSNQLNDIESMFEAVRKSGSNASLESLNIKPDESSGRLVILGGSNG